MESAWNEDGQNLGGGLEHFFHIMGIIIPIDQYVSEGLTNSYSSEEWLNHQAETVKIRTRDVQDARC